MAQQSLLELLNANKGNSKSAPSPARPAAYSTQAQNSLLEQIQRYKQEKKQNSVLEIFKQAATQPNKTNSTPKPSTTGPVSIQAGPYATYHYNVSAQPAEQTYTPGQAIQQSDYQKQIQARQNKVKQLEDAALQSLDFAEVLKGEGVNINPALRMTPLGTTTGDMENRYRHMTDEQQKVYDYYLKKGDQVTAAEYLNALESELDKAYGERIAQDTIAQKQFLKDSQQGYNETVGQNPVLKFFGDLVYGAANIGDDIAAGINTGADMAMQGAKQSLATAANILSGKDAPIVEDSAQQVADQLYTVQMGERSPVYGITTSVANMGVNALMGMAIPGSWAGSAAMGLTSAGNAYNQARKEGKTHEGAFAYGVSTGASETLLGKLLGAVNPLGQTGPGKVIAKIPGMNKVWDITQKALNKVSDVPVLGKVLNTASKLFNTSEAFEEYLQSVLEPVFRNIALGESNEFSLTDPDALYEGLLGGITGGLMNLSYNWINRGYAAANQKINPAFTPQMAEEFASQVEQLQQQTQSIVQGPAAPDTSGEPVQVGRATKIYHPYTGEIPQSTRQTPYPRGEISPQSLRSARDNIELAKMQAQNTGSNVRAVLKKLYNAIFDRTGGQRKIVVDGIAFEGVPYEVSLNKSAVKKVLSEKEITPEKLAVFDNIDDIINKADYVGSGEYAKTKKQGQTIRYDYFERPIVVDGKDYVVAFDVEVFPSQNNYRTHKIIEIDVHPVPPADPGPLPGARKQDTHLLKNSIPQNVQNSNKVINEINLRPQTAADPGPLPGAAVENTSLSNNSIPQNVQNSNIVKPSKNTQGLNPVEIANLPPDAANTTPDLGESRVRGGDGDSRFAQSVQKSGIFDETIKNMALDDKAVSSYETITNRDTMQQANEALNQGGQSYVNAWLAKEKGYTPQDIATGVILLERYQNIGDYDNMLVAMEKLRKMGTISGQATQMMSVLSRLTPEGMTYYAQNELAKAQEYFLNTKTKEWVEKNQERFLLNEADMEYIKNRVTQAAALPQGRDKAVLLGEIAQRIQNKLPPQKGQSIKALARISMLLNPKTIGRNILGNVTVAPMHAVSDIFGAAIDKRLAKKTDARTTGLPTLPGKAFVKGAFESFDDFKRKINTREVMGDRFEIGQGQSFSSQSRMGRALIGLDRISSFFLDVGDRPFFEMWFTNSINNQMKLNGVDTPTAQMVEIATNEALQRTWQDTNDYTQFVSKVRQGLNKMNIHGYGLGDVVITFVKTPANLTKALVDFSPIGLTRAIVSDATAFNRAVKNGTVTPQMQRNFVKNLSQGITGTLLGAMFYGLAQAGILKGKSDEDKDVKAFMRNIMGEQEYSIKIGDKSYSYSWAQPLGGIAAAAADIQQMLSGGDARQYIQGDGAGTKAVNTILSAIQSAGSVLLEQSFLQGLQNLFSQNNLVKGILESVSSEPTKFAPQFLSQFAQLQDQTVRTTYVYNNPFQTAVNKVKAKIPGLSDDLEPVVDVFGRDVKRNAPGANLAEQAFNAFLNPANTSYENRTPASEEVYRIYKELGDKAVIPPVAPYYIKVDGENIVLKPEERTQFQRTTGNISSNVILTLLNDTQYRSIPMEDKADILKDLYAYATSYAKTKVSGEYKPESWVTKAQQAQAQGIPLATYLMARYAINDMSADKDAQGKTIAGSKKQKVFQYINSLPLTAKQKEKLFGYYY